MQSKQEKQLAGSQQSHLWRAYDTVTLPAVVLAAGASMCLLAHCLHGLQGLLSRGAAAAAGFMAGHT
jgi:hypothetical protein